jgi:hypothetical protein
MVLFFRFIEKYGTHVVVGVKMGGKDVVHIKQSKKSDFQPTELQKLLKQLADERFSADSNQSSNVNPAAISAKLKVKINMLVFLEHEDKNMEMEIENV